MSIGTGRIGTGLIGVLLLAGAATAFAQSQTDRSFTTTSKTCDGVKWSQEALAQYPFLSEACGVEVTLTVTGRVTHFTFPDRPVGLQELCTVNGDVVASAGDNQIRARNVGADVVRVAPDGTLILTTTGQVPFEFTGVLKLNLDTEEVILEPHHVVDIEQGCAQLTT